MKRKDEEESKEVKNYYWGRKGIKGGGIDQRVLLAEIRFTPPRRARRRMAGLVMPWMLSRRILR